MHALREALFPMRDFDAKGFLDFCLVQHAVGWSVSRCGIFSGVQRLNMAGGDASNAMDGLGEVVPAGNPLVGEVVDAWHDALVDDGHDGQSQVVGVGGCAYLVENHAQLLFLLPQSQHRLDEVVAESRVEPSRADDDMFWTCLRHGHLASQLGGAIHAVRAGCVGLGVGRVMRAIKYIVGADLHHPSVTLSHGNSQVSWRLSIESRCQSLVALGLVHGRVGGAVHDAIDFVFFHEPVDGVAVGDVQFVDVGVEPVVLGIILLQHLHFVSQLAVAACDEYVHSFNPPQIEVLRYDP